MKVKWIFFAMVLVLVAACGAVSPLEAASSLLISSAANDLTLSGGGNFGSAGRITVLTDGSGDLSGILNYYDVYDAEWNVIGHQIDRHDAAGNFVETVASDSSIGWVGFVTEHNGDIYVGRTSTGADLGNHVIEKVQPGGTLIEVAQLDYVFDLQFTPGGAGYATYNPGGFVGLTKVVRVDLDPITDSHDLIAEIGGYSTELAFNAAGDLFVGTNGLAQDKMLRYSALQIDPDDVGFSVLSLLDATDLTDIPLSADGLAVDEAGNIVFSMNDYSSFPYSGVLGAIFDGKDYSGYGSEKYDVLSPAGADLHNVMTIGEVTLYGGAINDSAIGVGYGGPIAFVPEPTCISMLGLAGVALLRRRAAGK